MATETPFVTRYEQRVKIVHDIVLAHSKVNDKAASEIAVHVLRALDTIPEKVR